MKDKCTFFIVFLCFSSVLCAKLELADYASELFNVQFLGELSDIEYVNPKDPNDLLLISYLNIRKLNMDTGDIKTVKTFNNDQNLLFTNGKYAFVHQKNLLQIFDKDTMQLIKSQEFSGELVKYDYFSEHKLTLSVFITSKNIFIYNKRKLVFSQQVSASQSIMDFYIDQEANTIAYCYAEKANEKKQTLLYIKQLNYADISAIREEVVFEHEWKSHFSLGSLTKKTLFVSDYSQFFGIRTTNNKGSYEMFNTAKGYMNHFAFPFTDHLYVHTKNAIYFFENGAIKSSLTVLKNCACYAAKNEEKIYCFNRQGQFAYYIYDTKEGKIITNKFDNFAKNGLLLKINSHDSTIFTLHTENQLLMYSFADYKEPKLIKSYKNDFVSLSQSELFFVPKNLANADANDSKIYSNLYSKNLNLGSILINIIKNLLTDAKNIAKTLHEKCTNLKNKKFKVSTSLTEDIFEKYNVYLAFLSYRKVLKIMNIESGEVLCDKGLYRTRLLRILKPDSQFQNFAEIIIDGEIYKFDFDEKKLVRSEEKTKLQRTKMRISEEILTSLEQGKMEISKNDLKQNDIFLMLNKESNKVFVIKFDSSKFSVLNSFSFEKLVTINNPKINDETVQHHVSEGKIYYKLLDKDIYYLLTTNSNSLILTVINGKNGRILAHKIIDNVVPNSIRYVFKENFGVIFYVKISKGYKRNELFSFELLKKEIDISLARIIKNKINNNYKDESLSFPEDVEFLYKKYVIDFEVKELAISASKFERSNKYLILRNEVNDIYLLRQELFSPRRPIMLLQKGKPVLDFERNSIYVDKDLPPYNPVIKMDPNLIIRNGGKEMYTKINVYQTDSESVFIACFNGLESISCKNIYPDKIYDKLGKEFRKELIVVMIACMVGVTVVLKNLYKKAEFKKAFLYNMK